MRIISGIWKGKTILSPSEGTRPSTDRTRQALFSILQNVTEGASVLDLFAGSGSLGFESLSRGAKKVVAVENDRISCRVINKNSRSLKAENYDLLQRDVLSYLDSPTAQKFDLIFADPPYEKDFSDSLLLAVLSHPCWQQRATRHAIRDAGGTRGMCGAHLLEVQGTCAPQVGAASRACRAGTNKWRSFAARRHRTSCTGIGGGVGAPGSPADLSGRRHTLLLHGLPALHASGRQGMAGAAPAWPTAGLQRQHATACEGIPPHES